MRSCIFLLAILSMPLAAGATEIKGKVVHVRDADTIEIATSRGRVAIRLNGIDAPELDEHGGVAGREWMRRAYGAASLRCRLNGDRTYDRWVGTCFDPAGTDIGSAVIAAGLARDCPRYSGGRYRQFETQRSRELPAKAYCR